MSLSLGYQSLGIKLTGEKTTIPDNPLAKLMYYLHCVFKVIQYEGDFKKYTDYYYYYLLSTDEEKKVILLAALFNPEVMIKASLFINEPVLIRPGFNNEFFELSNNKIGIHVNSEVVIGGVSRKVLNIMAYRETWLDYNYYEPMNTYIRPELPQDNYLPYERKKECLESKWFFFLDFTFCIFCWLYYLCGCEWSLKCKRIIGIINLIIIIICVILYVIFVEYKIQK